MSVKSRLAKLTRRMDVEADTGPVTIFLCEADADHPPGRRTLWDGAALEIIYDPTNGSPAMPHGQHKLIYGTPGIADLV